jgi:hypothetical protein
MRAGTKIKTREGVFLITMDVHFKYRILRLEDGILSITAHESAELCRKHLEGLYGTDGLEVLEDDHGK